MVKLHGSRKQCLVVNGMEVLFLQLVSQREILKVETLAHLELFHRYFYNLMPVIMNPTLKSSLVTIALWMHSIDKKKKSGWFYNRLLQYSLVQRY